MRAGAPIVFIIPRARIEAAPRKEIVRARLASGWPGHELILRARRSRRGPWKPRAGAPNC